MKSMKEIVEEDNINIHNINESQVYDKLISNLQEAKDNNVPLDEGLFGSIFGGITGAIAGPAIGKSICKALSIDEKGMLGSLLTSRLFLTALGGYIGWKA